MTTLEAHLAEKRLVINDTARARKSPASGLFVLDNLPNLQSVFLIVLCYTKKKVDRKEEKNYTYSKLRGEYTKKDREIV